MHPLMGMVHQSGSSFLNCLNRLDSFEMGFFERRDPDDDSEKVRMDPRGCERCLTPEILAADLTDLRMRLKLLKRAIV